MESVFRHTPLYRFLAYCNMEATESRRILDCGAGGNMPPLSLFYSYGYETVGIDLRPEQVEKAIEFGVQRGQHLNIVQGDMCKLEYDDCTFDYVYSYNTVFHMKKKDVGVAISEMRRILKPGGLMFINVLSVDDFGCGEGDDLGENQYGQIEEGPVIHSYFEYDEAEEYLMDLEFVMKERRIFERIFENRRIKQGYIDYILRKSR